MINPFVVILPCAGSGSRLGSDTPKQYIKINGKTVLQYSIDLFLTFDECVKIVVAISESGQLHKDLIENGKIDIVQGGKSRAQSVKLCFNHLVGNGYIEDVLIHDAARPCLEKSEVKEFLELFSLSKYDGSIFAHHATDTVKTSIDGKVIDNTVNRSQLWHAETPQIFNSSKLSKAYHYYKDDICDLTDESSLFDKTEDKIHLYAHSFNNLKITFKEDLQLAEYLINNIKD